jgi:hypothetical protein
MTTEARDPPALVISTKKNALGSTSVQVKNSKTHVMADVDDIIESTPVPTNRKTTAVKPVGVLDVFLCPVKALYLWINRYWMYIMHNWHLLLIRPKHRLRVRVWLAKNPKDQLLNSRLVLQI